MATTLEQRPPETQRGAQMQVAATSFFSLFAIVGLALYGLPFFYDFMVRDFGWSRAQVTSGNAISKLVVGPLFGFVAGWFVDRVGPRRLMIVGILLAGTALVGLGSISTLTGFYVFYLFNALGNVLGGPLPNQVLLSRWFNAARGRAMGFAYLGIGLGGALVPLIAFQLSQAFGWHTALKALGALIVIVALPLALVVKEAPPGSEDAGPRASRPPLAPIGDVLRQPAFYLLMIGSMCSIAAVGGANQHLKLYLSLDHGYTQKAAAGVASLTLFAQTYTQYDARGAAPAICSQRRGDAREFPVARWSLHSSLQRQAMRRGRSARSRVRASRTRPPRGGRSRGPRSGLHRPHRRVQEAVRASGCGGAVREGRQAGARGR